MSDPSTKHFAGFPLIVNQVFFDQLADQDGQVLDGYLVHLVDREAGTLQLGDTVLMALKQIPFTKTLGDDLPTPVAFDIQKPRGAQWKRERNAHRRAW